jgi:N-hydroxyarylamine O-acetyltransferase
VNGGWLHQVWLGDEWVDACEFTLEEMPPIDRELANWFTSTHPESMFKTRLTVARALRDGGRLTILNREMTRRQRDGVAITITIGSPHELLTILERDFGLYFPSDTIFECPAVMW